MKKKFHTISIFISLFCVANSSKILAQNTKNKNEKSMKDSIVNAYLDTLHTSLQHNQIPAFLYDECLNYRDTVYYPLDSISLHESLQDDIILELSINDIEKILTLGDSNRLQNSCSVLLNIWQVSGLQQCNWDLLNYILALKKHNYKLMSKYIKLYRSGSEVFGVSDVGPDSIQYDIALRNHCLDLYLDTLHSYLANNLIPHFLYDKCLDYDVHSPYWRIEKEKFSFREELIKKMNIQDVKKIVSLADSAYLKRLCTVSTKDKKNEMPYKKISTWELLEDKLNNKDYKLK